MQKIFKKTAVQMRDQAYNDKDSISVENVLSEFRPSCDSSRFHEGAADFLFREFMNGSAFAAIKGQLMLSSNDGNKHERTIKNNAEAVNPLL